MTIAIADWQRKRRRGANAVAVRAKVASLQSPSTRVLKDVSIGSGDCEIEHLIIGSGGVFAVSVRKQPARYVAVDNYSMTVDGESLPHLRESKYQAECVARLLAGRADFEVPVRGCVVLLTGSHNTHVEYESRPIGVSLLTKHDVPKWFRRQPKALTPEQVEAVYAIASAAVASA